MKNILITGTSSGIGKITAEYLSAKGYHVFGTSRDPHRVCSKTRTFELDVSNSQSVTTLIQRVIQEVGTIDILINNAGYGVAGPIEETSLEEAKKQFETNFFGVARMTKAILPLMRANGGGMIINVSSIGGLIGLPFQGYYSASKFALEGFVEALRLEVKPFNIHVVNINPGDLKTSFTSNRIKIPHCSEAYQSIFNNTLKIYEADEMSGIDPIIVARRIESVIQKGKRQKIRHTVGNKTQTIGVFMKRVLGDYMFEKIMTKTYKIQAKNLGDIHHF